MGKPKRKKLTPKEREQLNIDSGYYKGGSCDSTDCYQELIDEILEKNPDLKRSDIYMLDHDIVGEVCVHIKGKWAGYVNGFFYEGDIDNWVWYCKFLEVHNHCGLASWDCEDPALCPHKESD